MNNLSFARSISVIFPCYNDRESIAVLVAEAIVCLPRLTTDFEIIVVDDGSSDGSFDFLQKLSFSCPQLRVIKHSKNQGYGAALISGFGQAGKDWVFYTDGDGQYDVRDLETLVRLLTPEANFINGVKMTRRDPSYRVVLGNFYSFVVRWLFWLPIVDVDCDFRLIRRSLLSQLDLSCVSGAVCIELVKKAQRAGAVFRQVSIPHHPRLHGSSQFFRAERLRKTFYELVRLWWQLMIWSKLTKKK